MVVHNVMSALFTQIVNNGKMHLVMDKSKPKNKIEAFNAYVKNKLVTLPIAMGKNCRTTALPLNT